MLVLNTRFYSKGNQLHLTLLQYDKSEASISDYIFPFSKVNL